MSVKIEVPDYQDQRRWYENRERFTFNRESIQHPFLARAGILDFNRLFELLPPETVQQFGKFPNIDPSFFEFIIDLRQTLPQVLNTGGELSELTHTNSSSHFLYPVTNEGFIAKIAKTKLFQRIFSVSQLGMHRYTPLPNPHTRGEHSIYATVNAVRTLKTLHEQNKKGLEDRLRRDFTAYPFYSPDMSSDEVYNLGLDLLVLTFMEHDQATPAGGDTFKYLINMNEESDLEWLFLGQHHVLLQERQEFMAMLKQHNLGLEHLKFILSCIKGGSPSLIGDMLHPLTGDHLDWDRVAYTLLDSQAATMLGFEIPSRLLPNLSATVTTDHLLAALQTGIDVLQDESVGAVLGLSIKNQTTNQIYYPPPTSLIDPSEDYQLNDEGNLINLSPEKLAWVAAFRIVNSMLHYLGAKFQGFEIILQRRLLDIMEKDMGTELLRRETLVAIDDTELFKQLRNIPDDQLQEILEELQKFVPELAFKDSIVQSEKVPPEAWATVRLKIKPGLDSKVLYKGREMTLKEFVQEQHSLVPCAIVLNELKRHEGKTRVIERRLLD